MKQAIKEFRGKYYFLSNFSSYPVTYQGIQYKNNEAAFQSMKVLDEKKRKQFENLPPNKAKALGRRVALRNDWESVKDRIMYEIVKAKFTDNPELANQLLDTGDAELVEGNHWNDTYWGVCKGKGLNKLGKILMRVRDELKEERSSEQVSKEAYVLKKVEYLIALKRVENKKIDPEVLDDLMKQWSFDYEMEKEYQPKVLMK